VVEIGDPGLGKRGLKAPGVGPGVLASANASALAHVDQQAHGGGIECVEKGRRGEAVDADGRDGRHAGILPEGLPGARFPRRRPSGRVRDTPRHAERRLLLREIVEHLRCPHCEGDLAVVGRALTCPSGHSFDIARQGHVSLLPGDARPGTADTREMVDAREAFFARGHFSVVADAVAEECRRVATDASGGTLVDLGAGTGYYLAAALDRLPGHSGIALDISKHAARRAARAHPRLAAVVCDAWRPLPVRTGAAVVVLSIFSPRNGAEMRRILTRDGALLLVTPARDHLAGLVSALGLVKVDERKEERLEDQLGGFFHLESRRPCVVALSLGRADVERLVGMGPSARHTDPAAMHERVAALPAPIIATVSLTLSVYRPR